MHTNYCIIKQDGSKLEALITVEKLIETIGYETIFLKGKYYFLSKGRDGSRFSFEILITEITVMFCGCICKSKRWLHYIKSELIIKEKQQRYHRLNINLIQP